MHTCQCASAARASVAHSALSCSPVAILRRRFIPVSTEYDGDRFFTIENGQKIATPLLLALAVVELSDVVFAVDSVPAVSCYPTESLCTWHASVTKHIAGCTMILLLSSLHQGFMHMPTHVCVCAQVFGVTKDPFIIYSSNVFAIISLRALYSFVASIMSELRFLNKAVALVLGFVGEFLSS